MSVLDDVVMGAKLVTGHLRERLIYNSFFFNSYFQVNYVEKTSGSLNYDMKRYKYD